MRRCSSTPAASIAWTAASIGELELSREALQQALAGLPTEQRAALEAAAARVRSYHEKQPLQKLAV